MRKQHYLNISQAKDASAYALLLNCRHCTPSQLREYASQNRIGSYLKEKLIERVDIQGTAVLRLTDKGYREFGKSINVENCRYHSNSIEHDLALADKYITVHREHPHCVWRNEEDLKIDRRDRIDELREQGRFEAAERLLAASVPDCVITTTSGISYGFDIVTDNYTQMDIVCKAEYCEEMQIEFKYERI